MASATSATRSHDAAAPAATRPGARPPVEVTALTARDEFLLELGQALGGQAAVQPVETLDAALEALRSTRRAQLLVIDAHTHADLRGAVDAAHAAAPAAAIVAFADAGQLPAAAPKGGRSFATVPLPFDAARARTVLEGAIGAAIRGHAAAAGAAGETSPSPGTLASTQHPPARATEALAAGDGGRPRLAVGIAIAAVALLAAAGGTWWMLTRPDTARAPAPGAAMPPAPAAPAAATAPPEAAVPEAAPAETALVQGRVDELLEKARAAMHARHFAEPAGDNALLYYRSAAAADPGSAEARDGLQRVAGVLATRFDEAMAGNRYDEAAANLASFRLAAPDDPRSAALEQRLYGAAVPRALADGNADRAAAWLRQAQQSGVIAPEQIAKWRAEVARHQDDAKLQRLAGLVGERIRDGKLLDGDDSARAYVQQLRQAAPASPATQRASQDLIAACLHRARDAALARNTGEQQRWVDAATKLGATPADVAAWERDVAGARTRAAQAEGDRLLALARDRLKEGRLTDPAQDCAAAYLTQLQAADPDNAALADARHALAAALLERARTAARSGQPTDTDLAAARRWGADAGDIAAVQQLAAPAATAPAAADPASLAANLKRLRAVPPDYPQGALAQRISGSVTLSFVVDTHGDTRDIRVLEATPTGVFDQAAINAVKHWRYAPMVVNGTAVEVPARARVHFELPK